MADSRAADMCECTPGWESMTCGYDFEDCACPKCEHGYPFNGDVMDRDESPHYCACDEGWGGYQCNSTPFEHMPLSFSLHYICFI